MDNSAEDMLGQVVEIGDTIAAAFKVSDSPALRVGVVTGFGEKKDPYTYGETTQVMEVLWYAINTSWGLPRSKTSKMETRHKRFLKITLDNTLQEMLQ